MKAELIPIENRIADWFYSQINPEENQESSFAQNITRNISKCAMFALVGVRNYFFVPLSQELPYPWAFVVGNMGAVTAFECWAGNNLIDDAFPKQTGLSAIFPKREVCFWEKIANVGNVVISLISQLPGIYPAMQYNQGPGSIPAGLIVGLGGAIFPMRSTQLAIQRYFDRKVADSSLQDAFVRMLRENRQGFIAKTAEEKQQFIEALAQIKDRVNTPAQIQDYLSHLLSITQPPEENKASYAAYFASKAAWVTGGDSAKIETYLNPLFSSLEPPDGEQLSTIPYFTTQVARVTGFALSCIYQYVIGVYTFTKTKETIWNNDIFAGGMAAAAVISELYLTMIAMTEMGGAFWQTVTGINKNSTSQTTTPGKLWPNTVTVLQTIGVGINLLSLGVSYVIWRDFFKDPVERTFFEVTMCGAVFLLFQAALPQVINGGVEYLISSWGTKEEKEALEMSRKYQYLADSIEKISPQDFNNYFLSLIPQRVQKVLHENTQIVDRDVEEGVSGRDRELSRPLLEKESDDDKSKSSSEQVEDGEMNNPIYDMDLSHMDFTSDGRFVRVTEDSDSTQDEY